MKIFAIESSSNVAGCAIYEDRVISNTTLNTGLFHSETLMVMVQDMFKTSAVDVKDIDVVAVSIGPGSFTGLRIGLAVAKGFAFGLGIACVGVDTLLGLAYNVTLKNGLVCCVLDARNDRVYNALFRVKEKNIYRLTEDSVDDISVLKNRLLKEKQEVFLLGPGAARCYDEMKYCENILFARENIVDCSAASIAAAAMDIIKIDGFKNQEDLAPKYLRPFKI